MFKSVALVLCLAVFASAKITPMLPKEQRITWELKQWIDPIIVGGDDADKGEFPHMIQLQYGGSHMCGASILNEEWVLTAAHCVSGSTDGITVVAGQWKLKENDGTEQESAIAEVKIHPKYGSADYDYDVALIRVKDKFTFNDHVQPIALYTTPDTPRGKARTSGWGRLSAGGSIPNQLQKLDVDVMEDSVCQKVYGDIFTQNMVCATGDINGGHCVCNGDSGSPLYTLETDKILQIGVVSWGNPCANAGYPAAYAEVGAFIDFIKEHVPI